MAHYYRNVNAVVFVYDVNNSASFNSLPIWINECRKHNVSSDNVPHLLIGNKCDVESTNRVKTDAAQVNIFLIDFWRFGDFGDFSCLKERKYQIFEV